MATWRRGNSPWFNPEPQVSVVPLAGNRRCLVIDNALSHAEELVSWAATQPFAPPSGNSYPGSVLVAPAAMTTLAIEHFTLHARRMLGARRTLFATTRFSIATVPAGQLAPVQWQCHRDRVAGAGAGDRTFYAAAVLYLFRDPALGGTSFYQPVRPLEAIDTMMSESQTLESAAFSAQYGLGAGYMDGSNPYFELVARIPAAWNRLLYYDGGQFHAADVSNSLHLNANPLAGRLTFNGFFTCSRNAS
jgi:hypothetical protein